MKNMKNTLAVIVVIVATVLGFNQRAIAQNSNFENTALVIIDVQNDYFIGGKMPLVGSEQAAHKAKELLAAYRAQNKPVIHIQHIALQKDATFFLPNTTGAQIHQDVAPMTGEKVITKHFPNSFRDTDLLAYLKSKGITKLVVCGMMTDVCVISTTRAAMDLGFSNTVISDACATRDREVNGKIVSAAKVQRSFLAGMNALDGYMQGSKQQVNSSADINTVA
jgi:nicotinamidase-related amidase